MADHLDIKVLKEFLKRDVKAAIILGMDERCISIPSSLTEFPASLQPAEAGDSGMVEFHPP